MNKNKYLLFGAMTLLFPLASCGPSPAPGPKYNLTVVSEDTTKGTVSGGGSFASRSKVTINATPNAGYDFNGWYENEAQISDSPSYSFQMPSHDINCVAKFKPATYVVFVSSEDETKGTVSGGGVYTYGAQVRLIASPVITDTLSYGFDGWYDESDKLVSKDKEYVIESITQNVTLKGRFKPYSATADFTYEDDGLGKLKVTSYVGQSNVVFIPDKVKHDSVTKDVVAIADSAFKNCSSMISVTIPNSVTSLGKHTFKESMYLESVTLPNSISLIDEETFYSCVSLASITIPMGVTLIGENAFNSCSKLASVHLSNSVSTINTYAFYSCSTLTSIFIPDHVGTMGSGVFSSCSSLTDVYCEAESKPLFWANDWLGDREGKAVVHWGYKPGNNATN